MDKDNFENFDSFLSLDCVMWFVEHEKILRFNYYHLKLELKQSKPVFSYQT